MFGIMKIISYYCTVMIETHLKLKKQMTNLSVKWANKLGRKGFNLDIIDYDRWKDDEGNNCETFVNCENEHTLYRIGNYVMIAAPGGKVIEFMVEDGPFLMNTIEKFLIDYEVVIPKKDRSFEELNNYFLEMFG